MERLLMVLLRGLRGTWRRVKAHPRISVTLDRIVAGEERATANKGYFEAAEIHERMLADRARVDAYHHAIRKHVTRDDTVVDLGTGTGILAFFASQQQPRRVYAIEHGEVVQTARLLAEQNGFRDIRFEQMHSSRFAPGEKVTVILHEQMGTELFNEDMVTNVCDLRDRLLAPGGRILPSRFELFLEPLSLRDEYRMPFLWEQDLHGVHFGGLKDRLRVERSGADPGIHRRMLPCEADHFLCEPESVLSFDLHTIRPDTLPTRLQQRKTVARAGRMDGVCLYFRAGFDGEIWIENSPFARRTSWNCHLIRTEAAGFEEGDVIELEWDLGDIADAKTWRLNYRRIPSREPPILASD